MTRRAFGQLSIVENAFYWVSASRLSRAQRQLRRKMSDRNMTIGELASEVGISRSTLLYYERLRLMRSSHRTRSNYRVYDASDLNRLQQICTYRQMGVPLKDIARLVNGTSAGRAGDVLKRRLRALNEHIATLRKQQRRILALLEELNLRKGSEMITKKRWVEIMSAAGMSDTEMKNWHAQFEKMEPDAHGEFLASLDLQEDEITRIRECSRTGNWHH